MTLPTLRTALEQEAPLGELPPTLPVCHISAARYLFAILDAGVLETRHCKVLLKDLLYMSYGALFYRPQKIQTQRVTELPIGLVFSPTAIGTVSSVFPFDSGAMATHGNFKEWRARMDPFTSVFQLQTTDAAADTGSLVKVLYKTNGRYLKGAVTPQASKRTDPLPLLASFLREDMTPAVDHRQRSIECLMEKNLPLDARLLWIGFPKRSTSRVLRSLYKQTRPHMPRYWAYDYTRNFSPAAIAQALETRAHEDVIRTYLEIPQ